MPSLELSKFTLHWEVCSRSGLLRVTHPRLVHIALSLQWVRRYLTATGPGIGSRDSGRLEED